MGLILLLPMLLLTGLLVYLESPGPIFFHQIRIGLRGREFRIHKFRTMQVGARGAAITAGRDSRITRVGRVLRALKIDELPQLLNVLKGEMCLVGPRPELPGYVEQYPVELRDIVLSVRPGITDLASLVYMEESRLLGAAPDPERYYTDVLIPAKLGLAESYVRNRSCWLDLRILFATLTAVFGWRWIPAPWSNEIRIDS